MSEHVSGKFDYEIFDMEGDTARYEQVRERLKSFDNVGWKKYYIDILLLSKAGFYFLEGPDRVKCFSCNLVLGDWNIIDCPWEEHAFWNPTCQHVKDKKGENFITQLNSKWRRQYC